MSKEQVTATAKYIRQSPRKIRALVAQIKDLSLDEALAQLSISVKKAARPLKKVLDSAKANAENNHGLAVDSLEIKEIEVMSGPTAGPAAKRVRFRARGRVDIQHKRSSHIKVVLEGEPASG